MPGAGWPCIGHGGPIAPGVLGPRFSLHLGSWGQAVPPCLTRTKSRGTHFQRRPRGPELTAFKRCIRALERRYNVQCIRFNSCTNSTREFASLRPRLHRRGSQDRHARRKTLTRGLAVVKGGKPGGRARKVAQRWDLYPMGGRIKFLNK